MACTRRDYLLYALSIGVPETELRWLYENGTWMTIRLDSFIDTQHIFLSEQDFGPLPTYPLCLLIKGDHWDVVDFAERWHAGGPLPGMPEWDINKMVHGEQSIEVINPFPVEGGRFRAVKTCRGVYDKGKSHTLSSHDPKQVESNM